MPYYFFVWTDEIIDHWTSMACRKTTSKPLFAIRMMSTKANHPTVSLPSARQKDGRYLCCVYEHLDETEILPVTAFEVE